MLLSFAAAKIWLQYSGQKWFFNAMLWKRFFKTFVWGLSPATKIKLFIAREIQYFELGVFSLNSYLYYITCGFSGSIRVFNLLTCAFNLATRAYSLLTRPLELVTHEFELLTRGFEFVTRKFELVTQGFEVVTREFELVTHGFELVIRGFELVTRVLWLKQD